MTEQRITILGDGQMGLVTALMISQAEACASNPPRITVWGHFAKDIDRLAQTRVSQRLPMLTLPEAVHVCSDLEEALSGASLIVSAIPTQFSRGVWERAARFTPKPLEAPIVSLTKGVEIGTLLRPTQVVADVLHDDPDGPPRSYCVLSGPTIAAELGRCLPATMIAASDDQELASRVQKLCSTSWLRVYTGVDPLGVELAGATKNVIALAAGIIDGLQAGYNAKSALLARGLAEIARLGAAMGADRDTFFGLAGVGDLATTCFSPEGRNRSCGEALGKGQSLDEYIASSQSVVEGVATTRSVVALAEKYKVEMPITRAVHAVLYEGLDPIQAISRLMSRELRQERVG